jgi:uncharacterized membrane protein YidH (DUF202 family)
MSERSAVAATSQTHARDHLANERTLNAWVRTALGMVGLGVALPKLVDAHSPGALVGGVALIIVGAVCVLYSGHRYLRVSRALHHGEFPIAGRAPVVVVAAVFLIALGALLFVLTRVTSG